MTRHVEWVPRSLPGRGPSTVRFCTVTKIGFHPQSGRDHAQAGSGPPLGRDRIGLRRQEEGWPEGWQSTGAQAVGRRTPRHSAKGSAGEVAPRSRQGCVSGRSNRVNKWLGRRHKVTGPSRNAVAWYGKGGGAGLRSSTRPPTPNSPDSTFRCTGTPTLKAKPVELKPRVLRTVVARPTAEGEG